MLSILYVCGGLCYTSGRLSLSCAMGLLTFASINILQSLLVLVFMVIFIICHLNCVPVFLINISRGFEEKIWNQIVNEKKRIAYRWFLLDIEGGTMRENKFLCKWQRREQLKIQMSSFAAKLVTMSLRILCLILLRPTLIFWRHLHIHLLDMGRK